MTVGQNSFARCVDRKEVIQQLAGAASMCWERVDKAGVFQSEDAISFCSQALEKITELDRPLLGLATTQELLAELEARFRLSNTAKDPNVLVGELQCRMLLGTLAQETLAYRTADS